MDTAIAAPAAQAQAQAPVVLPEEPAGSVQIVLELVPQLTIAFSVRGD
jgi:hypothetical protein